MRVDTRARARRTRDERRGRGLSAFVVAAFVVAAVARTRAASTPPRTSWGDRAEMVVDGGLSMIGITEGT